MNDELERARSGWKHRGGERPPFAQVPKRREESVWDYPRPPALVEDRREVVVRVGKREIARTARAVRVLETASPPTFYIAPDDVDTECLFPAPGGSFCEWKGSASYFDVQTPEQTVSAAAWAYLEPFPEFTSIAGWLAFYPSKVSCFVAGELVRAQAGGFYGGWVTREIVGPFKGEPETSGW
ncbi:MAG: DUF427 domain-containing protein [Gammaproteobacteria bacterium]|nr:MAG: DUF427 domain-containing protein [Gammaproteobacteria bacterium]